MGISLTLRYGWCHNRLGIQSSSEDRLISIEINPVRCA